MKKSIILIAAMLLAYAINTQAQIIPDSLRVDWSKAGYQGSTPQPSLIINVKDFGAYGDSSHDDYTAIMNAMNSSTEARVIYFPAGNYLIKSSITPSSNVIFRGDGTNSNLIFDLYASNNKNAISITSSQSNSFTAINSGYIKGSSTLNLVNTSGFTVDSYAEIREANGSWDNKPASWATYCVGQIVKVTAINGNQITIDQPLRLDYDNSLHPEIRPVIVKNNIGFEYLKITRADTIVNNKYGYNINFSYAADCWVTGVEFSKSQAAHILLEASKNISVSGSYFHDAFTYDGTSTAGYGVVMIQHNSDCIVDNCVFKHLRHAMVAKQGANGNVFAYNYSLNEYRSEAPHDGGGDMVLHGHYPFANLFEGNIGQTIMVDDTWGPAGPYNTFFRNRAELYGISIYDGTVKTRNENIVGNEITNGGFMKGVYFLQSSYHFTYNNNVRNTIQPKGTNNLTDSSYYLKAQPSYWNINSAWPSIGGNNILGSGTNPAKERYLNIGEPMPIIASIKTIATKTCKPSGSITVTNVAGGKSPYYFSLNGSGFASDSVFNNLSAGTYFVLVKDSLGCIDSLNNIVIESNPTIVITAKIIRASSCRNDGSITISQKGGQAPFTYSIDGKNYISANIFTNLSAGNYTAWVKAKNGCTDSLKDIVVGKALALKISVVKTNASCKSVSDGTVTINASGGTKPYVYSLDSINYSSNNVFTNLIAGDYTAWIKDAKNCTAFLLTTIKNKSANCSSVSNATSINAYNTETNELKISISPNPSSTDFVITLNNKSNNEIKIFVTDMYGRVVYSYAGPSNESYRFGNNFMAGIYTVTIIRDNISSKYKIVKQ